MLEVLALRKGIYTSGSNGIQPLQFPSPHRHFVKPLVLVPFGLSIRLTDFTSVIPDVGPVEPEALA